MDTSKKRFFFYAFCALLAFGVFYSFTKREPQDDEAPLRTVSLSFEPSTVSMSELGEIRLMTNPNGNSLAYQRAVINFDPAILEISEDVTLSSELGTVIEVTKRDEANSTGRLAIALGIKPGDTPLTDPFEFAKIPFRVKGDVSTETRVTLYSQDVQLVNIDANVLPFTNNDVVVTLP